MSWFRAFCSWVAGNYLRKRGYRRLQASQAAESQDLVGEIKGKQQEMGTELADIVLRLDAVSDRLEQSLEDLREPTDE